MTSMHAGADSALARQPLLHHARSSSDFEDLADLAGLADVHPAASHAGGQEAVAKGLTRLLGALRAREPGERAGAQAELGNALQALEAQGVDIDEAFAPIVARCLEDVAAGELDELHRALAELKDVPDGYKMITDGVTAARATRADALKGRLDDFGVGQEPQARVARDARPAASTEAPRPAAPGPVASGPAARYTTWGGRFSFGHTVTTTLRYLTLSAPAMRFGDWLQHGHDRGLLHAAGVVVKGFASLTGGASAVVGSAVTMAETLVVNLVGGTLRVLGAAALGTVALGAKLIGRASPAADRAGDEIGGAALKLVKGISLVNNEAGQEEIPLALVNRANDLAKLARITGSKTPEVRAWPLPTNFERAPLEAVPRELLSVEGGGTGAAAKLRYDPESGLLTSDSWSGLMVGVYLEKDPATNAVTCHLSFVGTQASRPATLKSDVAQSALGIEDSAFKVAEAIARAFVQRYGAQNVQLQGHSLGGALAQWAGIRNSGGEHPVRTTCFNGAGLHIGLRNRLGDDLIARADVRHFNTEKDFLSQTAEGAHSPILGVQVGHRYLVPESKGHSLKHHLDALEALPTRTAQQHDLPLSLLRDAVSLATDGAPMRELGHGAVNQVFHATAIFSDGARKPGVYKKDKADGIPRASIRNVATSRLDQRLGLGVIVPTALVIQRDGLGSFMELLEGVPPSKMGNQRVKLDAAVADALRAHPDRLAELSKGFVGARIEGNELVLVNEYAADPDDPEAGMQELPSQHHFETDSRFIRDVTNLQWLDALTGQRDRNSGNYFLSPGPGGEVRVQGIDNDLAFDADLHDPDDRAAHEAPRLPRVIDARTAQALLALTPEQVEEDCAGLSDDEIAATQARLEKIQVRVRELLLQPGAGRVMEAGADWKNDARAQDLLGITALQGDAQAKSIDYMYQQAGKRSYAAREIAAFEFANAPGQPPWFDADAIKSRARALAGLAAVPA